MLARRASSASSATWSFTETGDTDFADDRPERGRSNTEADRLTEYERADRDAKALVISVTIRRAGQGVSPDPLPSSMPRDAVRQAIRFNARTSMEFNCDLFAQNMIIGLANGSLIALIALGYTLVYGIVELINFAHGEVFMMGAFFAASVGRALLALRTSPPGSQSSASPRGLLGAMLFSAAHQFRHRPDRVSAASQLAPTRAAHYRHWIQLHPAEIGIYWKGEYRSRRRRSFRGCPRHQYPDRLVRP